MPLEVLSTHIAQERPGELFLTTDARTLFPRDLVSIILVYGSGYSDIQPGWRTTDPWPPLHLGERMTYGPPPSNLYFSTSSGQPKGMTS